MKNGIVLNWLIMNRKKRASSNSNVVQISLKLATGIKTLYCYVRGETQNQSLLNEYSLIMVIRNGSSDINLVYMSLISGLKDCRSVTSSNTSSSMFCIKKTIYKTYTSSLIKDGAVGMCHCIKCVYNTLGDENVEQAISISKNMRSNSPLWVEEVLNIVESLDKIQYLESNAHLENLNASKLN